MKDTTHTPDTAEIESVLAAPMPPRLQRKTALALTAAIREMSLLRRGGVPFSDIAEALNQLREMRDLDLAGESSFTQRHG